MCLDQLCCQRASTSAELCLPKGLHLGEMTVHDTFLSFLSDSYRWKTLPKSFKGNESPFKNAKLRHYNWKQLAQQRQEMNSWPLESSPGNYCLDHPSSSIRLLPTRTSPQKQPPTIVQLQSNSSTCQLFTGPSSTALCLKAVNGDSSLKTTGVFLKMSGIP